MVVCLYTRAAYIANSLTLESQRPWVTVVTLAFQDCDAGTTPHALFRVGNIGKSPATTVVAKFDIGLWATANLHQLPKFIPKLDPIRPGVLFPNESANEDRLLKHALSPQELKDINTGAETLFVFGLVTYKDDRRRPHHTQRCFAFMPKVGKPDAFQACSGFPIMAD